MSNISIGWHMIIRGHLNETTLALNSLQGLYDNMTIAVDDRPDSDEVFEALKHYPNTVVYRQCFDTFGRYDLARQDCLDKVPTGNNFHGWSDSDEILVTDPLKIRQWLFETQPDAVNCGIHYVYGIGGHEAGQTYRNGRVRIWKYGTRRWSRPCHEYPVPINGIDEPVDGDIIFNHIKEDNSDYRADHHIELMQKEIESGNTGWMFYQAKEFEIKGDLENAVNKYLEYLKTGNLDNFDTALSKVCEFYLGKKEYTELNKILLDPSIPEHPMLSEYLAITNYYGGNKDIACRYHTKAKVLDVDNKYPRLMDNDKYFMSD